MITVTQYGHELMRNRIVSTFATIHLYTDNGELEGHGYGPKELKPALWSDGAYPEQVWTFEAGDPVDVLGYYISDKDGKIILSEQFNESYTIKNAGDVIVVQPVFRLFAAKSSE